MTLAVSILTTDGVAKAEKVSDPSPPVAETSKRLKTWAVDVLNKLGPVPFPKDLGSGLGDGSVYFPPTLSLPQGQVPRYGLPQLGVPQSGGILLLGEHVTVQLPDGSAVKVAPEVNSAGPVK